MDYADNSYVPTSWATLAFDPFQDGKAACLPCQPNSNPPAPAVGAAVAPPPAPGMAPCVACPTAATWPARHNLRNAGPPCCTTETYAYNAPTWPWAWGGVTADGFDAVTPTPRADLSPQLWQDLYAVKNRTLTGFEYAPIFNPYVL